MTQAIFFLIIEGERHRLSGATEEMVQKEVLEGIYSPIELLIHGETILRLYAPPVFDDRDEDGPNQGEYGDQSIRKREWIESGELYILRV